MPQSCASCSAQSPDGAKFCLECGRPFSRACPACGHVVAAGKFCIECGSPLSDPVAAPAGTEVPQRSVSELRTTTVLFGDLVAFTTLSESRDPEEVRELLSTYFTVARTVVGRYGGTIEKFIGDAVMAVWGVPVSHEDDAERAVRAGMDLVAEVAALGASVGAPDLAMRVGIVTGSVAVTLGAVNEGMVAGDAVNTASRVQTAAEPGTVWVDQETQGLTAAAVAFSDMGEHLLKGKAEPVRLFRADTVVASVGGVQRVDGLEAPMAGRDRELRTVRELLHATEADGRARLGLVTGLAGIGKSRLGWEFEKYTDGLNDPVVWHRGRCLSYGDGVAFWAFAEMIRSRLGLLESDDQAEVVDKVRAGVAAVAATPAEAAWLTPRVAALLGIGEGEVFDRTDLFASWTTFLERVGRDDPVVLLFEDMQYADSGLLDLVDHLLATSRSKLYVLILTRPELLAARPALATNRRATLVELEPLPDPAMNLLCDGLVADLPDRARAALVARAEGVPLYAVETVRSLIDRDAVIAQDGRYVFVDHDHHLVDLDQLTAPITLQTLIAARLDTLSPGERRVVQDASVLGLFFPAKTLAELSGLGREELDAVLGSLVRKGVLDTENDPRSPELGQYRFLQAIFREVAYSTLSRKDRRTRHLAVASILEREEVAEAASGVIAQHLVDALEASGTDDPERPAITTRARALLTQAATRSETLGSSQEAARSALAALDLSPEPVEAAQLRLRASRLLMRSGDPRHAAEMAARAGAEFAALGLPVERAMAGVIEARSTNGLGRIADAGALATELMEEAELHGVDLPAETRIDLLTICTGAARAVADHTAESRITLQLARVAEESNDPVFLIRALNMLSIMLNGAGASTAQLAVLERCLQLARETQSAVELGRSLTNVLSETYPRDLSSASVLATESVSVNRRTGDDYQIMVSMTNAGYTWLLAGDWDHLVAVLSDWLERDEVLASASAPVLCLARVQQARGEPVVTPALPPSEDPYDRLATGLVEALVQAGGGDVRGGAERAAAAWRAAVSVGEVLEDFEALWAPAVELQLAAGDLDTARFLIDLATSREGARGVALTRAELPRLRGMFKIAAGEDPEADLREAEAAQESYGAPYLLARTRLELARWLHGQGRTAEAAPLLAAARAVFVELRAAPGVEAVDHLLQVSVSV